MYVFELAHYDIPLSDFIRVIEIEIIGTLQQHKF